MAKKAIVILAEGFEEIEAVTCIDILRRAGIDLTVAGLNSDEVRGSRGLVVKPDQNLDQAPGGFDACVLPGGMPGASNLAASKEVISMIKTMAGQGKLVAAICASPAVVLTAAGLLENRSATCYPGMEDSFGPKTAYKKESVVIDGNIITSRGPATAMEFGLTIAERLAGKETAAKVRKAILID